MQKFGVVLIGFENLTQERCGLCPKLRVRSEYLSEHSILRSFNEKPLIAIVLSDVVHPYVSCYLNACLEVRTSAR
jgi:hypothetical protein